MKVHPPKSGARILFVTASLVLVVAGLREIRPIALPFMIALFLAVLSAPLMAWMMAHRFPRPLSVVIAVLANVAAVGGLLLIVGGSLNAFAQSVPEYQQRLEESIGSAFGWLEQRGVDTSELAWIRNWPPEDVAARRGVQEPALPIPEPEPEPEAGPEARTGSGTAPAEPRAGELIGIGAIVEVVGSAVKGIASLVTLATMIFLILVFLLAEATVLPRKLEQAFGWRMDEGGRWAKARREIQRYLVIKTLVSLATGVLVGTWTWALGVDYPALWGVLAFVLNYIPSVGSIVAAVPPVLLSLIDSGVAIAIAVAAGFLVVNMVLGNFLEPHLLGRRLGMSTLVIILSLLFWGWLWGPLGMLLAVPMTMVVRIVFENTHDLRWVAQLIAAKPLPSQVEELPVEGSSGGAVEEPV